MEKKTAREVVEGFFATARPGFVFNVRGVAELLQRRCEFSYDALRNQVQNYVTNPRSELELKNPPLMPGKTAIWKVRGVAVSLPPTAPPEVEAKSPEFTLDKLGEAVIGVIDDLRKKVLKANERADKARTELNEQVDKNAELERLYRKAQERIKGLNDELYEAKKAKGVKMNLADLQAMEIIYRQRKE